MTARFNKNVLSVINGRLGADFDLFSRRAAYDAKNERVEMWLDSEAEQAVRAGDFGATFQKGEGLRTEISARFTPDSAARTF